MGYGVAFEREGDDGKGLAVVEKSRIRFSTNPWGKPRRWIPTPQAAIECVNTGAVDAASGSGFFKVTPESDGVTRAVPLVAWSDDTPYRGFAVALLAVSLGARRVTLRLKGEAVEGLEMDGLRICTDPKGRLPFREYRGGMTVCSAADLLAGKLRPGRFSGKIVIIGSGKSRLRTRAAPSVPRAVIQATAVENALRGDYLRRSRGMGFLEVILIIGIPLCIARLRGWRRMVAALGVMVLLAAGAVILAVFFRQETRMFFPAIAGILSWLFPFPPSRS
jgi:CHASE2 domain-containing sensor protein